MLQITQRTRPFRYTGDIKGAPATVCGKVQTIAEAAKLVQKLADDWIQAQFAAGSRKRYSPFFSHARGELPSVTVMPAGGYWLVYFAAEEVKADSIS